MAKATPKAVTTKADDIEDMLGGTPAPKATKAKAPKAEAPVAEKPAKATKAKAPKAEAPVAEKPAKATKAKAPKAEKAPKAAREPITFEEGERDALMKRIPKLLKNPINSKDLAAKLDISTRKLRPVLYSLHRAGTVDLELGASRTAGMTVSTAAAA